MITLRFDLGGITAAAPRSSRSARSQSASNAFAQQGIEADAVDERSNPHAIVALPRQQDEADEVAQGVDQRDDFARQAASRASDGVILSAPFCAARLLMDGDDRAIDHCVFEVGFSG